MQLETPPVMLQVPCQDDLCEMIATAAARVVDNDTNTALACRSLCTAVGKWLQTLLSHPTLDKPQG